MIYMYMLTSFADCFQIQLEWIEWTFWLVANSQKLMHKITLVQKYVLMYLSCTKKFTKWVQLK